MMDVKAAQRELKSCEQHLADIREIMIVKEAKLNQLKAKRIQIENNLPSLFAKVALGEIPSEQLEQAKEELKDLKRQQSEIPILLKGLKSEEPRYIERISKAKRIIDIDRGISRCEELKEELQKITDSTEFNRKLRKREGELRQLAAFLDLRFEIDSFIKQLVYKHERKPIKDP